MEEGRREGGKKGKEDEGRMDRWKAGREGVRKEEREGG